MDGKSRSVEHPLPDFEKSLKQIQEMPEGIHCTLKEANSIYWKYYIESGSEHSRTILKLGMIPTCALLGYKIVLSGDEYEDIGHS